MKISQTEIEAIVDEIIENTLEIGFAGQFTRLKEVEYALEYLKNKIEDFDPNDFLE